MYELTVEHTFCAAHALSISGNTEPVHGHNWNVRVTVYGPRLDADGLLCDFHLVHRLLIQVIQPFHNADLNKTPPFDRLNPSAELVARHIAFSLAELLPPAARLHSVSVTEAPGCIATFTLDHAT